MSRSTRKSYIQNAPSAKEWKRKSNRKLRRTEMEIDLRDGNMYKKFNEVWTSPMENKGYWDNEKIRRK